MSAPTCRTSVFQSPPVSGINCGCASTGKAITFLLATLGARVIICSRTESKRAATQAAVKDLLSADLDDRAMTMRDPEQVEALPDHIWSTQDALVYLINNAGGQFLRRRWRSATRAGTRSPTPTCTAPGT